MDKEIELRIKELKCEVRIGKNGGKEWDEGAFRASVQGEDSRWKYGKCTKDYMIMKGELENDWLLLVTE